MKTIIVLTAALLSLNSFALTIGQIFQERGQRLMMITKQLNANVSFSTKQGAVDGALAMMEDISSGDMSKSAKYAFRRSFTLHDSKDKCRGTDASRAIESAMAKGKFEVNNIKVGSYFNGQGTEAFSYTVRYLAPCKIKDRD